MNFKLEKGYKGNIIFQELSLVKALTDFSHDELKTYLYISVLCSNESKISHDDILSALNLNDDDFFRILTKLQNERLIDFTAHNVTLKYTQPDTAYVKPAISPDTVNSVSEKDMRELIFAGEKCFKKMLSVKDVDSLASIKHYYNFDTSVLTILLGYVEGLERKSMAYVEKLALDWYEKGIDTPTKAHDYIKKLEENNMYYGKYKNIFGIYNRNLTKKEKDFCERWFPLCHEEAIAKAYESMIDTIGKISLAYMEKILKNPDSPKPVSKEKSSVKSSKFNNFHQDKSDFSDIKKKKLQNIMNKLKDSE